MNENNVPPKDINPEQTKPDTGAAWPSFSPRETQPGQTTQENDVRQDGQPASTAPPAESGHPSWQGYQSHGMSESQPPNYPQINIPPSAYGQTNVPPQAPAPNYPQMNTPPQVPPPYSPSEPSADYMPPPGYPQDSLYSQGNPYAAPDSPQPPPGYPYQPYGTPQMQRDPYNMAGPGYIPPIKRKRSKGPIIAAVAVFLAAAVAVVVVFGDTFLRTVSPEASLALAISRTLDNMAQTPSALPNLDRFEGQAMSHEISVDITDIIGSAIGFSLPGMNTNAVFTALTDWENENLLLDLSLDIPFFSISDNQIFISPDTIGISIPLLLEQYGFITVNTTTFTEDWNNSAYADLLGELPYDFDLAHILKVFFADMRGEEMPTSEFPSGSIGYELSVMMDELTAEFELISSKLVDSIRVDSLGGIAGTSRFRVTVPAEAATSFMRESSAEIFAFTIEYYRLIDDDLADWLMANGMRDAMYIFDSLRFNDDLIIEITVGRNGLISDIFIPDTSFDMSTGIPGDIVTLTFGHETFFLGREYVLHDVESFTFIADDNGSEVVLFFENFTNIAGDYIYDGWEIYIEFFDYGEFYGDIVLSYLFWWQKDEQQDDNMALSLMLINGFDGEDDTLELEITGRLAENSNATELSSGVLNFMVSDGLFDDISFNFNYRANPVPPSEVSIAGRRSTDLFSISFEDLLNELGLFGDLMNIFEFAAMLL